MKSLGQIKRDNIPTPRDFGGMCEWFVFCEGNLVGCFVHKNDAEEFMSLMEYDGGPEFTLSEPS